MRVRCCRGPGFGPSPGPGPGPDAGTGAGPPGRRPGALGMGLYLRGQRVSGPGSIERDGACAGSGAQHRSGSGL